MEATQPVHIPILTDVLLSLLALPPHARCIDATINGGGHTAAMLERLGPQGKVLGIDRDPDLLVAVQRRLAGDVEAARLHVATGSFRELTRIAASHHFTGVDAILFDVGVSSYHFDASGRGFSFLRDEPLDMRFNPDDADLESAQEILASRDVDELTAIFRDFGEERYARRIANRIVREREEAPLRTTQRLFDIVTASVPPRVRWQSARSAARVFQALRIAVNDELNAISDALPQALSLLAPGGKLAVLAFHSLEDRIVKQFFVAERSSGRVRILTKKPIRPTDTEIKANPRSASAKLRVAERI